MADVSETAPLTDAATAVALGKRHLLVRDYNNAVNTLIQACELLVKEHGDGTDELAEPYLLYGKALLGLAREESNILGSAVPGTKDSDDEDAEDDEEVDEDEKDEVAEKGEDNKTDEKKGEELGQESEKSPDGSSPKIEDKKSEETKSTESKKVGQSGESNVTDDKKAEEKSKEDEKSEISKDEATPGSSKMTNGDSSSAVQNGEAEENGEDDNEEANEDEDVDNLEVAWEVLELAKLILVKRGPAGWKFLAEAHKLLGEVAMEGGNPAGAVTDFQACLELMQKMEPCNPRAIAEIYYQLGLAFSFMNDFDSSIEQFREASSLLEARIKELEQSTETPKSDDPFYSVENEIKELKELLPEIGEKISDMKDARQDACKRIIECIREKASASNCSNGASTSSAVNGSTSAGSSSESSSKPVSDISHLIRKKRKPEETAADEASPCKKLSPQ